MDLSSDAMQDLGRYHSEVHRSLSHTKVYDSFFRPGSLSQWADFENLISTIFESLVLWNGPHDLMYKYIWI